MDAAADRMVPPRIRETTLDAVTTSTLALPGLHLNMAEVGPKDGLPTIVLHGFPEF